MPNIFSLYLHFPFCKHLCNYCDFYKSTFGDRPRDLNSFYHYFEKSLDVHDKLLKDNGLYLSQLQTLYIGGGTPSLWGSEGVGFIESFLQKRAIKFTQDHEFTLEVNPGEWTSEQICRWEQIGVNRFSIGVQTLNGKLLPILDRVHNLNDTFKTLDFFGGTGRNYSLDIMLGLPSSMDLKRDVVGELKQALNFAPSHVSVYILTTKDHYIHAQSLPDEEWIRKEYLDVFEFLNSQGFIHYEVSNFAKPSKESKHNLMYWKSQSVAALGPSATGYLALNENRGIRYKWKTTTPEFVREDLGPAEVKLEKLYLLLRTHLGINPRDFFWESDLASFLNLAMQWENNELGHFKEDRFQLNHKGLLILDSFMSELFKTVKIS